MSVTSDHDRLVGVLQEETPGLGGCDQRTQTIHVSKLVDAKRRILRRRRVKLDRNYELSDPFFDLAGDLAGSIQSWRENAEVLLDPGLWRIDHLTDRAGYLRPPLVRITVDVTSKGNLTVRHFPDEADFRLPQMKIRDQFLIGDRPNHEIVFLRGIVKFAELFRVEPHGPPPDEADRVLAEAVQQHLTSITHELGRTLHIRALTNVNVGGGHRGISVAAVSEVAESRTPVQRRYWLEHISREIAAPSEILQTFAATGGSYAATAQRLARGRDRPYGSGHIARVVDRLWQEYVELYDQVCSVPPHHADDLPRIDGS